MVHSSCLLISAWRQIAGPEVTKQFRRNWRERSASLGASWGSTSRNSNPKGCARFERERNQYARTSFEIRDEYWPYHRTQKVEDANGQGHNAYVDAIRRSFVSIGCTIGNFSARDAQLAEELQRRRIPLELVQDALLMGACRKYISWLNGGSAEPIGSLRYFEGLVAEIRERPLPADYTEYLQRKMEQLTRAWESAKPPKSGGCLDMPRPEIVQ